MLKTLKTSTFQGAFTCTSILERMGLSLLGHFSGKICGEGLSCVQFLYFSSCEINYENSPVPEDKDGLFVIS